MLVSEAMSQAQALTGQVFDQIVLLRWLSELDGQLAFDLYHADAWQPYSADDLGSELLIPFPWDGTAYVHHLEAMTYFSNGEYDRYANARTLAENALGEFRRFVQRSRQCCKCEPFDRTGGSGVTVIDGGAPEWRYISAYAEAVKHGFSGTPEEWLESLVGEKGDTGDTGTSAYEYAVSKGYTGTETEYATLMASYATVAQAAAQSATQAAGSEANAAGSATAAAGSATAAAGSATAAAGSAAAAATDRGLAQTARTGAETAQTAAETAQGKAEDAQEAAEGAAEDSEDAAEDAEAWAVGQRGGVDVPSTDETFHNNAKYWAGIAEQAAGGGVTSFNGRTGSVTPQSGDYTAAMVGADVSGAAAAVQSNLNTHASNTVIHITAAERATWNEKQNALTFDDAPTSGSQNPVTSGGVHTALANKQNVAENEGTVGQVFTKTATGASWQNADGGTVVFDGAYTEYRDIGHTTPTVLSTARNYLAGASVGDYALFGGGYAGNGGYSAVVDAYNASLTRSTPTALSTARRYLAGASVGDYALFGGGATSSVSAVVDAYSATLTRSTPTALSTARQLLAGASVGSYALFGGGNTGSGGYFSTVDAYNASLTRSTPTALSTARGYLAGASVGDYALFGGGVNNGGYSAVVDAYNASLTRTTATALIQARQLLAGASVGHYALLGGGSTGSGNYSAVVDAYNASLTRSTPTSLSQARSSLAGASVGDYALFGGGNTGNDYSAVVDAYDASLTRTTATALSAAWQYLAGASVGDYALFGGGNTGNDYSDVVNAYGSAPQYVLSISIPQWSKYHIDGVTSAETLTLTDTEISAVSDAPFTGYIKRGFTLSGLIS